MTPMTMEQQRIGALRIANQYRLAVARECERIARLKDWRKAREEIAQLIEECEDDALLSGRIAKYLNAPRYVGKAKVGNLLAKTDIRRNDKRLRDMTDRQRREIAQAVRNGYKFRRLAA